MEAKELCHALSFVCTSGFWRMSIPWTFSLIMSYLQLFAQRFFHEKLTSYTHSPPLFHPQATVSAHSATDALRIPVCVITGHNCPFLQLFLSWLVKPVYESSSCLIAVGRSSELSAKAIADIKKQNIHAFVKAFQVDISSFKSILMFKRSLQEWLLEANMHSSIQLLINNAGILATSSRLSPEGYDQ